jgi:hypothetical protein
MNQALACTHPDWSRPRPKHPGTENFGVDRACDAGGVIFTFDAELWMWDARQADTWIFASLPTEASAEIRDMADTTPVRGFGSVRVRVTIGASRWATSIFPGAAGGSYSLPIKKAVRKAEALGAGDVATVTVELVDF